MSIAWATFNKNKITLSLCYEEILELIYSLLNIS